MRDKTGGVAWSRTLGATLYLAIFSASAAAQIVSIAPDTAVAGTIGSWVIRIPISAVSSEVTVSLPRWWQVPQVTDSTQMGFVTAWVSAASTVLVVTVDRNEEAISSINSVRVTAFSKPLQPGDTLFVGFGLNGSREVGITPNKFAGVQSFGIGIRNLWSSSHRTVSLLVLPRPAKSLRFFGRSVEKDVVNFRISAVDEYGNLDWNSKSNISIATFEGGPSSEINAAELDSGRAIVSANISSAGLYQFTATSASLGTYLSNPILSISEEGWKIYWGDVHTHTDHSGHGWGSPKSLFEYGKEIMGLDWVVYSEHDNMGRNNWGELVSTANQFNSPAEFVSIIGTEYTPYVADKKGHMNLLFASSDPPLLEYTEIRDVPWLLRLVQKEDGIVQANHPFLKPYEFYEYSRMRTDVMPLIEMVNGLQSYEFPSADGDACLLTRLKQGWIFGFSGGSDNHFSQPGKHWTTDKLSGLTAVICSTLTRESIIAALKERRTYATNGTRPLIDFSVDGSSMGSIIRSDSVGPRQVEFKLKVIAAKNIDTLRIMTRLKTLVILGHGSRFIELALSDTIQGSADFCYLYVSEVGGGKAWTSPVFFRPGNERFKVLSPRGGDSVLVGQDGVVRFSWSGSLNGFADGPMEYSVSIFGPTFDTTFAVVGDTSASMPLLSKLHRGEPYGWYVSAIDGKGGVAFSDTVYFGINETNLQNSAVFVPSEFFMFPSYPNPFNASAEIRYGVSVSATVRIVVYDIRGRVVKVLVERFQDPGFYTTTWQAGSASSGVYFSRIEAVTAEGVNILSNTVRLNLIK